MKQTIMKKYAALLATFCLCAALAPGLAFAVEEEYQAGSLADGTEVTTQAEGEQYAATVSPSTLELTVGYTADVSSTLTAAVSSIGSVNGISNYDITYQWYSATSADPATGTVINGGTNTTYAPVDLKAGTYYYYCVATMTKKDKSEEPKALTSNVATVTVKNRTVPDNVEAINETLKGAKDGAIVNVTKDMEWRSESDKSGKWNDCAENKNATTIEELSAGKYQVRLKKTENLAASEPLSLTVGLDAATNITIGSNAPKVKVPNLDEIALNIKASSDVADDETVEIDLEVNAIASNSNNEDVNKIKAVAKDKTLTCFGLDLSKKVGSNAEPLTNLENDVLEINVEYTTKDRKNIVAYRVHDGKAEAFKSLSKKPESDFTDGTYYVGDGTVTIYSSKFSTYALGYDTKANDANQQQNTTPATGDTLPGVVPFAIVAAIAIVAMVVARRFIRKTW